MKSIGLIIAGFLLGLTTTYCASLLCTSTEQPHYIDQTQLEDKEIEALLTVELPKEQ
jgi:hypothetical protein